ncbi:MAG: hypothetical protein VKS61_17785 [Candidatus Sericytochromatia bacterium]|nr:hypothetical protein [Candidatus Sericytochromatia bacterium]
MGRTLWAVALWGSLTLPAGAAPVIVGAVSIDADRLILDEGTGRLEAEGHVVIARGDLRVQARKLVYDRRRGTGRLEGPLKALGLQFELEAQGAEFHTGEGWADLLAFKGRWADRGRFWGRRLRLSESLIELEAASAAACTHDEPDLLLEARRFAFDPRTREANLVMQGLSLRASVATLLSVPEWRARLDDSHHAGFDGWVLPSLGFDAYQGWLSGTRLPFNLGPGSTGSLEFLATTGRGLASGLQHALRLGPGEVSNAVRYETPWATGQGGLRALNRYTWRGEVGGHLELAGDYRANLNETAVHRLPELTATSPTLTLSNWLSLTPEVRAGYLWEELSAVRTLRGRVAASCTTGTWEPLPGWRTWGVAAPWAAHYTEHGHFTGVQAAWHAREQLSADTSVTQMLETLRTSGATPMIHDRLIAADRLRLGLEHRWHPRVSTRVEGVWSRMLNEGPWLPEDALLVGTYRWNCFALDVTLRPLVGGFDTRFRLLEN